MKFTERDTARFWAKVALPNEQGCMLWLACKGPTGYGSFGAAGANLRVHRVSYILAYGSIPDGLVIDHLCRVRHCVNPAHLEAVTQRENVRRGNLGSSPASLLGGLATGALSRAKTHCPRGHAYSDENTYVAPLGDRRCRECAKAHRANYLARSAN